MIYDCRSERMDIRFGLEDVMMAMNRKGNVTVLPDKRLPKEELYILECTYRQLEKGYKGSRSALRAISESDRV